MAAMKGDMRQILFTKSFAELINTSRGIDHTLLTGIKRMARRANLDM